MTSLASRKKKVNMSDKEKLEEIYETFQWCMLNENECNGTKYEEESYIDNWYRLRNKLDEIFE